MSILPAARPGWDHLKVLNILGAHGVFERCALLGVRGYFQDSMGKVGINDREIYDDALFSIGPDGYFRSFNFNTDPNGFRKGHGTGSSKGMGSVEPNKPGEAYRCYIRDIHGGSVPHRALCQRVGPISLLRDADSSVPADKITLLDGVKTYRDVGTAFGANLHRGGVNSTSSIACQTVPPSQWDEFFVKGVDPNMTKALQHVMPYVLIECQG